MSERRGVTNYGISLWVRSRTFQQRRSEYINDWPRDQDEVRIELVAEGFSMWVDWDGPPPAVGSRWSLVPDGDPTAVPEGAWDARD